MATNIPSIVEGVVIVTEPEGSVTESEPSLHNAC
jgi:hypothetical protein